MGKIVKGLGHQAKEFGCYSVGTLEPLKVSKPQSNMIRHLVQERSAWKSYGRVGGVDPERHLTSSLKIFPETEIKFGLLIAQRGPTDFSISGKYCSTQDILSASQTQ